MATPSKVMKSSEDSRITFEPLNAWQKEKNALLGSEYTVIEPNTSLTSQSNTIEFDINSTRCLLFGPMSKLIIRGGFETREVGETAGTWKAWKTVPATEASKVCLAPNWFEMLIKQLDIFHQNSRITSSNEPRSITPWLNTLLYRLMDPIQKKILCPQESHFANCIPPWKKDQWGMDSASHGSTWTDYAAEAFGKSIVFEYTPLNCFPFTQGANHLTGDVPRLLPTPLCGRLQMRITMHDNQSHIFRKKADNTNEYRFNMTSCKLLLEEARLTPAFEKSLLTAKRVLTYPGTTRIALTEPISEGTPVHKAKFQDIYLPESLLIFALPKEVASGTYKFSTDTNQNVFRTHNINAVQVSFNQSRLYIREPYPGEINETFMDTKQMLDHIFQPVMGVPPDIANFKVDYFKDASINTSYPHVYLPLVNFGTKSRTLPALDDGSALSKKADLEIDIRFEETGTAKGLIYIIYAIYTDVATTFDCRTRLFGNPYNVIIN